MNDTPIFSPSQVQDFTFCQQLWAFQRQGWVPRVANRKMIAASWSIAAHAGLVCFHRSLIEGKPVEEAAAGAVFDGAREWLAEIEHHQAHGVNYGMLDIEAAREVLVKLIERYTKESLLLRPGWTVLDVEREFPAFGNARVDIVAQDPDGLLVPVDFKIKREINSKWFDIQGWVDEFAYTGKQVHYMVALEQETTWNRPVTRHYIYGITAKPWDQLLVPYDIPGEYKAWWLESSRAQWQAIERAQGNVLTMHPTHRSQYGTCEFLKACTSMDRDPQQMGLDFVQVPRRREITEE